MRLYHYTCAHSINGLRRTHSLMPNRNPVLGGLELAWLTDLDQPDVNGLGLTSHLISCRRTEYRVVVEAEPDVQVIHWPAFARELLRHERYRTGVLALHEPAGVLPMHWWVSSSALPVVELEPVSR